MVFAGLRIRGKIPAMPESKRTLYNIVLKRDATGVISLSYPPDIRREGGYSGSPVSTRCDEIQEPIYDAHFVEYRKHVRPGFGRLPSESNFTRNGARTLREWGVVTEEEYGNDVAFLTLTLPGTSDEAFSTLARYSSYVVQNVSQLVRDVTGSNWYAWVWEWQDRGALHLHVAVAGDYARLVCLILKWKESVRAILRLVQERSGVRVFLNSERGIDWETTDAIQQDARMCQKSCAAYLSKYMGKKSENTESKSPYFPTRWWRISKDSLAAIKVRRATYAVSSISTSMKTEIVTRIGSLLATDAKSILCVSHPVFTHAGALYALPVAGDEYTLFRRARDALVSIVGGWQCLA